MTGVAIFRLVLLILVFLVWAFLVYRTLSLFREREAQEGGGGLGQQAGRWWRAPEDRRDRNTLLFMTAVLVFMVATRVMGNGGAAG